MMLEQLISGYLDGDLTADQDRELRQVVNTDPVAKDAFDAAVLIHIAMRCEDDTETPQHLRSGVFDVVDALAAQAQQGALASPTLGTSRTIVRGLVLATVALLAFWLPIGHSDLSQFSQVAVSDFAGEAHDEQVHLVVVKDQPTTVSSDIAPEIALLNGGQHTQDEANTPDAHANHDDPRSSSTSDTESLAAGTPAFGEGRVPDVPLSSIFQGQVTPSLNQKHGQQAVVASGEIIPWVSDDPVSVTISTAYAAGMSSTLASASNVEQVSASLAYGLSESDALGFEVGAMSYSIRQSSSILVTSEPVSAMMRTVVNGGEDGKLSSPDPDPDQFTTSEDERVATVRTAWGSAFYERLLVTFADIVLIGRAGAGVSEDGLMGFGRLTGQWEIGSGISLVVGAEARSMPFQVGAGAASSSQITYGGVVSAVTGLNVRF